MKECIGVASTGHVRVEPSKPCASVRGVGRGSLYDGCKLHSGEESEREVPM
jgi:hypothetical protein